MSSHVESFLFALALTLAPPHFASAAERAAMGDPGSLEPAFQLVRAAVEKNEVPGAVALVARNGKIVRQDVFGLRDIENRLPFTTNTLCWIASITKPVTVAAAM